jgi:hypothetical protein
MATRGMYIFENFSPRNVYVHWDNDPEGAAAYFAEWLTKGLHETPETFCALSEGKMEQDEHSHLDIEWRYRLMWPQLNPNKPYTVSDLPPNHLLIVLAQNRKVIGDKWTTEFCGPMFLFLEKFLDAKLHKYIDLICDEAHPKSH